MQDMNLQVLRPEQEQTFRQKRVMDVISSLVFLPYRKFR